MTLPVIAPAGFWPRRPKPEEASQIPPRIRNEKFGSPEKNLDFARAGLAKDCRNFAGGRINTRRILGAESSPRAER